jgi:SAM-dependent methyltransferase
MDYDDYAATYAHTRWAVPWILEPLRRAAGRTPSGATIVEIGCGTGNYVVALAAAVPGRVYKGFDLSTGMLQVARARRSSVEFAVGNADQTFPYGDRSAALAFAVDVVHHLERIDNFICEAARILEPAGELIVVTDSAENVRRRSLTRFFPEILAIELARYPELAVLHAAAGAAGFDLCGEEPAEGSIPLDDEFIAKVAAKCSSAMRLISEDAHARGLARLRTAAARGESWLSCYTVLRYRSAALNS